MGRSGLTFRRSCFDNCRPPSWSPSTPFLLTSAGMTGRTPNLVVRPPRSSRVPDRTMAPPARNAKDAKRQFQKALFSSPIPPVRHPDTSPSPPSRPRRQVPDSAPPARPCGGRRIGSKYPQLAQIRLLFGPAPERPGRNVDRLTAVVGTEKCNSFRLLMRQHQAEAINVVARESRRQPK